MNAREHAERAAALLELVRDTDSQAVTATLAAVAQAHALTALAFAATESDVRVKLTGGEIL